jgi:hypothetical protein
MRVLYTVAVQWSSHGGFAFSRRDLVSAFALTLSPPSLQASVCGLKFFAVCCGLRLAHLQEFLQTAVFVLLFAKRSKQLSFSQFLHSLNVNPCTPTIYRYDTKKFLMAAHKAL